MTGCAHLGSVRDIQPPSAQACPDCLAEGSSWVHLRQCLQCGQVGCCDSSPKRHASAHFHASAHPIVRSIEPAESWRWCFVDEAVV